MLRGIWRWFGLGGGQPIQSDPIIFTVTRSFSARARTDTFSGRTVARSFSARTRTDSFSG